MGYTKKLSELICLSFGDIFTKVSVVRFGNVLGSSGSVIPKFQAQINNGGPVTVSHPQVTRYFMLVSEAAELVLQTTTLTAGNEVFVLDMGDPIKILDLAKMLIHLHGYKALVNKRNNYSKGNYITIIFSNLSEGEKLHEELFESDKNIKPFTHEYLMKKQ